MFYDSFELFKRLIKPLNPQTKYSLDSSTFLSGVQNLSECNVKYEEYQDYNKVTVFLKEMARIQNKDLYIYITTSILKNKNKKNMPFCKSQIKYVLIIFFQILNICFT